MHANGKVIYVDIGCDCPQADGDPITDDMHDYFYSEGDYSIYNSPVDYTAKPSMSASACRKLLSLSLCLSEQSFKTMRRHFVASKPERKSADIACIKAVYFVKLINRKLARRI